VHKECDSGVYIAVFYLRKNQGIRVGRLGRLHFRQGVYFYAGSAQRDLSARLELGHHFPRAFALDALHQVQNPLSNLILEVVIP